MTKEERANWRERLVEQRKDVKLLWDENLPRSLKSHVRDLFPDSVHVSDVDLLRTDDSMIWDYAYTFRLAIVTKDGDFAVRVVAEGPPPSVVRILVGNCPVWVLISVIRENADLIKTHVQFGGGLLRIGAAATSAP